MPVIPHTFAFVEEQAVDVPYSTWTGIVTGDTAESIGIHNAAPVAGSVQFGGTFGGATVKLQASNDDVTFFDMKDLQGVPISSSSAALFEFTSAAIYFKPVVTGGSANSLNVILVLRG
jgi:hypothetical protein